MEIVPGEPKYGTVSCPNNYKDFCAFTPECPNYCSQKGVCIVGVCSCHHGFTGKDCSVST